jgi:dTDP-glucose 4,6-dehydratase
MSSSAISSVLVTGGAGFIGANFIPRFVESYPQYAVINLDKLTYASDISRLSVLSGHPRYKFVQGDITNAGLVSFLFSEYDIKGVLHFAAESHVDNSISGPEVFVRTNVHGTFVLLNEAYKFWLSSPFVSRPGYEDARFLQVSTDEVYGSLGPEGFFTEDTPYSPRSPYSASKASADMLVRSFHHTYGLNTVVTNCSNNFGPGQHDEKLIPTIIRNAVNLNPIPIYGNGQNVRDWIYVLDHCAGVADAFTVGKAGETYNIGADNEQINIEIARKICFLLDEMSPRSDGRSYIEQITYVKDRPGHDLRYAIDASKIKRELGWRPAENFDTAMRRTLAWYLDRYRK